MDRKVLIGVAVGSAVAGGYGVLADPPVNLQSTTPGVTQAGHTNISGTARAGTVIAYSSIPSGIAYGGDFRSVSTSGRGILGNASATTGATYGGLFQAASSGGRGVAGIVDSPTGTTYGGFFSSLSTQGRGVYGQATAASGTTYGVYGKSSSPAGFGVFSEGNMSATGIISGNGSGLSSVNAAALNGMSATAFGRVASANDWTGANSFSNPSNTFVGNGSGLTGVSLTLPYAQSGSGGTLFELTKTDSGTSIVGRANSGVGLNGVGIYGVVGDSTGSNGGGVYGRYSNANFVGILGYYRAGVLGTAPAFPAAMLAGTKPAGADRWLMCTTITDGGQSITYGNGSTLPVTFASHIENEPTNGSIGVTDGTVNTLAGMYVNEGQGYVYAGVKTFRAPNPRKAGTQIVYACIEGPEVAAYARGSVTLANGRATIILPDHFQDVVDPNSITVSLTPCSADSNGLAVISKSLENGIVVAELNQGRGSYGVDYLVMAVRKGHQDFKVIQPKLTFNPAGGLRNLESVNN